VKHLNVYSVSHAGTEPLTLTLEAGATTTPPQTLAKGESWKVRKAFAFEDECTLTLTSGSDKANFTWKDATPHTSAGVALGSTTVQLIFSVTESPARFDERYVNIHAIRCEASEEMDATEVYMIVKSGGNEVRFPNAKDSFVRLDNGQSLEAHVSFPFEGDATVELWDEDTGEDDPLGTFDVAALTELSRAELRMDAFFKVDYSVTEEIPAGFQHVAAV